MEKSDLTILEKYRNYKKQEEYLKIINNHVKNEKEKPLNKKRSNSKIHNRFSKNGLL